MFTKKKGTTEIMIRGATSETLTVPEGQNKRVTITLRDLVPPGHKLYHLFTFIDNNYGSNPADIMRAISAILDFDKGLKSLSDIKASPIKNIFNLFKYSLPAALYGVELVLKIKKYISETNREHISEYEKSLQKIKNFLDLGSKDETLHKSTDYLNEEIILWLLTSPKTEGYKILGYYNDSFETLDKISIGSEQSIINIFVEYGKEKILINLTINMILEHYNYDLHYISKNSQICIHKIEELEALIIKDYIHTFNTQENILEYRDSIVLKKRPVVSENINQFNVEPFIEELKIVLKFGRKRGYGFIGYHGTGKSIILKKIEEILTGVTIIRFNSEKFSSSYQIRKCFKLIKIIQPAVVIIEDMDAFGFKEKNERVETFINEIDDINNDLNIVLIVTINDTRLVHRTIIDRPGRFDEIIEIKAPQSCKEVYDVMESKFKRLKLYYTAFKDIDLPPQEDLQEILEKCIKDKFTQAELTCGIIEKVFITIDDPKNCSIVKGIEDAVTFFEKSKRSLSSYSFNEKIEFYEEALLEEQKADVTENSPVQPDI